MYEEFFEENATKVDTLTGLYNRDVVVEYIGKLISENKKFALCMFDLDNFKYINDGYGHLFGDHVLIEFAKALNKTFEGKGLVGRYGGDEFVGVLENVEEYDDLWQFLHTCLCVSSNLEDQKLNEMSITCTTGAARFPKDATSLDNLFELADKALYRGKMKGRNCFIIYLHEKHANINLKTERDKVVSSMYLHAKVFNSVCKLKYAKSSLQEAINFLGNYFMIDHLCITTEKGTYFNYYYPICKKREFVQLSESEISTMINDSTGICYINSLATDLLSGRGLVKKLIDDGIYSILVCKIAVYGKSFGYVRADITENPRGRKWQNLDIDVLLNLAHTLALELYYQGKEIDTLED